MWRNGETKHCPNISLSFLCSLHPSLLKFFTVCTVTWKCKGTDCILPGFSKLASVQVLTKRMQEKGECTLTQMPATWPTCLSVLRRKRKELEKLWNGPEIQLFFFFLPLRRCQDIFHNFAHECSVHLCVLSCQCTATVSPSETHL